jgi:hypothetical protein
MVQEAQADRGAQVVDFCMEPLDTQGALEVMVALPLCAAVIHILPMAQVAARRATQVMAEQALQ